MKIVFQENLARFDIKDVVKTKLKRRFFANIYDLLDS
jgi:hypothetical protein